MAYEYDDDELDNLLMDYGAVIQGRIARRPRKINERLYFDQYDDVDFKRRFRLQKRTVEYLLTLIEHRIRAPSQRNDAIEPMTRLLLTLRFYATGNFLVSIADFGGVSESSACGIVWLVTNAIASLRPRFIKLPSTSDEIREIQSGFFGIAGVPRVVGTIDCTHVKIQSPGGNDAEYYRNRKGYFSYNVQTLCDHNLKIRDIVARWPGSSHDTQIFNHSILLAKLEGGDFGNGLVLGDGGYACRDFLLTPLLNPRTEAERRYNESHIATRNTVERQYGNWKRMFPVLRDGIRLHKSKVQGVIVATAVLYNLAKEMNEPDNFNDGDDDDDDEDDDNGGNGLVVHGNAANRVRNSLISYFGQR